MAIETYMADDSYLAYYYLDSKEIHINIQNIYRRGYKKTAKRYNEVVQQEVICIAGNIRKLCGCSKKQCYAEQCPIKRILWRLK